MIAELGHFALILSFCFSILLAVVPVAGAWIGDRLWMRLSRPLAGAQFLMAIVAFAALTACFLRDDFSVRYVAGHSNSLLPWYYKFSAVWGGHEGSLLLWALILTGWTAAVAKFSKQLPLEMVARVLGVMGMISIGFMLFILMTSNPFLRYLPNSPQDGADLNPLLQDFGLIVHPPMLYMGYVGFSVAFAFAVAALMGGRLDAAWARWSRPWTTVAWAFLTLGIALGSWWAYYELGWGGWWFWDPVENASFMPWLVGTALMHSLAATEKRGVFKSWTVLLAIFAFSLSLLGTFLVRSGILTSVHAFASDPERGRFVLMMLGVVIGGSLLLYALRAPVVKSRIGFSETSREVFLLVNNIILVVAMLTVLIGTLAPLVAEWMDKEISVGAPYFNLMFSLLVPLLVIVMGVGMYSHWKDTRAAQLLGPVPMFLAISTVLSVVIPWMYGEIHLMAVIGVFIAVWLFAATLRDAWLKSASSQGRLRGWLRTSRSYKGMVLGHLGLAVTIVGATMVSQYTQERDVRLAPGQSVELAGFTFRFDEETQRRGPNFIGDRATVSILDSDGDVLHVLHPEKRRYQVSGNVMTEAGINPGLFRDLYVSLGESLEDESWTMRVQYKPFVRWLWLGGVFMAWGGFLAVADRRYRIKLKRKLSTADAMDSGDGQAPARGDADALGGQQA
ncbi:heme lyase CcmF/NrfE family subunit [Hahella aquimaris]|uniref:heme lyase CcmF/NrfE family subunit n=1 Tax=Hahella sp. HNIBRBA332 TaxID=3015983 RepID=UPI00273A9575|nr:heme lyase CcmF/NrfE family subunit [Hahella sp. HNIBRBA332]WLQ17217.1 heme lyase CcmF/NrfE family subunit [Hahella sp. HNIBRBA332]